VAHLQNASIDKEVLGNRKRQEWPFYLDFRRQLPPLGKKEAASKNLLLSNHHQRTPQVL
jgi:hypothetical protein